MMAPLETNGRGSEIFWQQTGFDLFIAFFWVALAGLFFVIVAFTAAEGSIATGRFITAALMLVPLLIHGTLLTLWHWKSRYRGKHSMLWGALLILETTGWFKLIYLIRHVFADRNSKGRYAAVELTQATPSS